MENNRESRQTTSIRLSNEDRRRIARLRKRLGGVSQSSVITMALAAFERQQRPPKIEAKPPTPE